MSTTAVNFNVQSSLGQWIRGVGQMYCKDLDALSDEQFTACCAGKARTPQDFTAEVIGMNFMVAKIIAGEAQSMPNDEERAAFVASINSREVGKAKMTEACEALAAAVEALPDSDLGTEILTPWGQPMTKYGFANLCAGHVWYHDGQLNYIQSMNGDAEIHWM